MPDFQPDPSIFKALTGPAVVAQTPADWQQEAERTQAAVALRQERQAMAQERQAKAQEAAQARADEALVRQLAVTHQGDPDKIQAALMQVNPVLGAKVGEDIGKWRQAQAVALKEQNANDRAQHEQDLALLEAAGDNPAAYAVARTRILKSDPDMATLLPEQPDPVATANALKSGQALKDIFARRDHSIDMAAKGEWNQSLSAALDDPEVDTPEEWNDVLKGQRALGAPPEIIAQFGAFDPDPQKRLTRVRQLGLTPDQRSDAAHAAATLANTITNQNAQLDISRGQLDVSRGQLGVARGNLGVAQGNLAARRAEAGAGGVGPANTAFIDQILANPAIYADLTDAMKTKLAPALAAKGFTAWGKPAAGAKGGPDVSKIIGEIDTLSKKINTSSGGPTANLGGYMRQGFAKANWDNDVSQYDALVTGMIPMVARAVGHTGVLTQPDVDSVRSMFPTVSDNQALAARKMATINRLIGGSPATSAPSGTKRRDIKGGGVAELRDGKWIRVE